MYNLGGTLARGWLGQQSESKEMCLEVFSRFRGEQNVALVGKTTKPILVSQTGKVKGNYTWVMISASHIKFYKKGLKMSLPCVTVKPNLIIDFVQGIQKVSMQRYSSTTCMLIIERDTGTSMVPLRDCIFSESLAGSRPTSHQVRRMVPAQATLFYKMPLVGCPLCRVVNQLCDIVELRLREEKQSVQPRGEASNPYLSDKMQSRKEAKTSPILATAKEVGPGEPCVTIEENQCVVCLTAECEIEFTTCGHRMLCKPCLRSFLESKGIRTKKFNDVTTYDMKRAMEWDG